MGGKLMADTFLCPRRSELGDVTIFELPEADHWRPDGTCSHCGSVRSQAVFEAIAASDEIIPTDKNYKIYINPGHRKFYFQHFSEDEKKRFIDQVNAKNVKLGYPGHFYVTPYFATTEKKS